jgi:hypothetical protein
MVMSMNLTESNIRDVFIALSDKYSGVFTNEVSPQELIAYESNKGKKKRFLELTQTMTAIEAIETITEGRR